VSSLRQVTTADASREQVEQGLLELAAHVRDYPACGIVAGYLAALNAPAQAWDDLSAAVDLLWQLNEWGGDPYFLADIPLSVPSYRAEQSAREQFEQQRDDALRALLAAYPKGTPA